MLFYKWPQGGAIVQRRVRKFLRRSVQVITCTISGQFIRHSVPVKRESRQEKREKILAIFEIKTH